MEKDHSYNEMRVYLMTSTPRLEVLEDIALDVLILKITVYYDLLKMKQKAHSWFVLFLLNTFPT